MKISNIEVKRFIKNSMPTILSYLAVAGVIGTSIEISKASVKAHNKIKELNPSNNIEKAKIIVPIYIPPLSLEAATIMCILGANILNKKSQAVLASSYALINEQFKEYRSKLIEFHGKEEDEKIRSEIVRSNSTFHELNVDTPDKKVTFFEPYSETFLNCYEREIMDAEYHINRNFILKGSLSLNEYYDFLGLPHTKDGDDVGWRVCEGYMWLDFEHEKQIKDDGNEYYVLQSASIARTKDGYLLRLPRVTLLN